ncbi:ribosomal protein L1 [Ramaria rubella]|nr:ribosomal protein L1 [Ramaria rubella]
MAVSTDSLVDDHVSIEQCKKAVSALLKHAQKKQLEHDETQLLPGKDQYIWLVMTVKQMQPMKALKPHKIPLTYPIIDPRNTSVCLITKDPQREYKDLLESHNIKFISRVVGIEKLKGKFRGFDARRLLLREHGLFLGDERVLPLLPKLLGKQWFKAKKQPIPVSLTKKDLKGELERAISSTYMHQNQGTCTSIKIAGISHKSSQVVSNLQTAIPAVVARIHGGWDNVQSFSIKTTSSVSLPIWTCSLGNDTPGSRWAGMTVDEEEEEWGGIGADLSYEDMGGVAETAELLKPKELTQSAMPIGVTNPVAAKVHNNSVSPDNNNKKRVAEDACANIQKKAKKSKTSEREVKKAEGTKAAIEEVKALDAKPKKSRKPKSTEKLAASAPTSSSLSDPPPPSKRVVGETLTRKEMSKKKDALGDATIEKKKEKLRETQKSTRKGVKAQLVGRVKA